jgi:hypothetical protein
MSRLDSFIRRLEAQRVGLDWACAELGPGLVLEIGLGNGRTYDHLRGRLGGARAIHAFDRAVAAHPDCVPPEDQLHLGDIRETLPAFAGRFPQSAALVHADIGSGLAAQTATLAAFIARHLPAILAPRGLVVADQPMACEALAELPPPTGVDAGRYFFYRRR